MTAALGSVVALIPVLTAKAAPATKGSLAGELPFFLIIGAAFYFLILRPQQRKTKMLRQEQALTKQWEVGDEVLTAGGLIGHVIEIDDDRVTLETSVGASFVVLNQYILRRLDADVGIDGADDEDAEGEDDDHEGHDHDDEGSEEDHDGGDIDDDHRPTSAD